jgi:Transposase DDE domain
MSHRDFQSKTVALKKTVALNADCLNLALQWLLGGIDWSSVTLRRDCTWSPSLLAAAALMWAWGDESTLGGRFLSARRLVSHVFVPTVPLAGSYQSFVNVLRRWTEPLMACLKRGLRERMQHTLARDWSVLGFVMFAVDGSRCELARTVSNERAFSATRPGKRGHTRTGRQSKQRIKPGNSAFRKADSPQLWVTAMWHVGSGLLWDWRADPGDSSERAHLLEMLPDLPPDALVTGDAGFVGYQYLRAILDGGRQLLIRVGANVRLLKKLGYVREYNHTVYLWPDREAARHQPPLVLRLVTSHNGRHPLFLVTSIPAAQLTDLQVLTLYSRRWGIELFYRSLKQTFDCRKLRSHRAEHALLELHWSLLGLWTMTLYALAQFQTANLPPVRLSVAQVLRAFRRTMRDFTHPAPQGDRLPDRLRTALIDTYQRNSKSSRNYPRKRNKEPAIGIPKIRHATNAEIALATQLRHDTKKGLTA